MRNVHVRERPQSKSEELTLQHPPHFALSAPSIETPLTTQELQAYERAVEMLESDPHSSPLSFVLNFQYVLKRMSEDDRASGPQGWKNSFPHK